jgi:peptidoglycan/xylan/chitin deacetylase (PgdA/CDA1 family)
VAHYLREQVLPARATLITFDDGYRDALHCARVLQRYGYPAVAVVPVGYIGQGRPLPHERRLAARGLHNRTLDWRELRELDAQGVRVECHGIEHRPLRALTIGQAAREIALSKLRLEEALGREVKAFAYVKGSKADFGPAHVSLVRQAGYDLAFTAVAGANGPHADRYRLRRYNVEPYPARTFELVLRGACDPIGLKDTVAGTYAKRALNTALRTRSE